MASGGSIGNLAALECIYILYTDDQASNGNTETLEKSE